MEQYAYLLFAFIFALVAVLLLLVRRDFLRLAPKFVLIGVVAAALAELIYYRDYWRPPTLLGEATISLEDFLFGAAAIIIVALAYPVLRGKEFVKSHAVRPQKKAFYILFLAGALATIVLNLGVGINSVLVTSAIWVVAAGFILYVRRDLIRLALASAAMLTVLAFAIYAAVFNLIAPDFWDKYWLLADTKYGLTIAGNVPLTEMLWYFAWGLLGSVCYPFVSGRVLANANKESAG